MSSTGSTPTEGASEGSTTGATTTGGSGSKSNNGSTNQGGQNTNAARRNNQGQQSNSSSVERNFQGKEPSIGSVMGLRSKRIDKKTTFDLFRKDLANYIDRTFDEAADVVDFVKYMEDPTVDFENLYKPVSKTEDELKDPVTKSLQDQEVKMYLARKNKLRQNKNKIWGLLIGQCSAALASVIEHKSEYRRKDKANDVLWLLNEIKQVSSGLDMKCNRRYMYHEALLMFITMKQGDTESLDAWMNRIESNCQNLIMAGGEHVLSSPQLMPNGGLHATDEEIK